MRYLSANDASAPNPHALKSRILVGSKRFDGSVATEKVTNYIGITQNVSAYYHDPVFVSRYKSASYT